jgi:hypothetical protein
MSAMNSHINDDEPDSSFFLGHIIKKDPLNPSLEQLHPN